LKKTIGVITSLVLALLLISSCSGQTTGVTQPVEKSGSTPLSPVATAPVEPAPVQTVPATALVTGTQLGNQAPDFQLKNLDGKTVSLSDFRGKPVWINFWATW